MDVLREREAKDSLERQLVDERKLRGMLQVLFRFIYIYLISSYPVSLCKYNCLLVLSLSFRDFLIS